MKIPRLLLPGLLLLWASTAAVQAGEPPIEPPRLDETELKDYRTSASFLDESNEFPLSQVTNVSQLRDVSPGDWA